MPRKKPTLRLGVFGKNDVSPENAVENFVESKLQNKWFIKEPNWDVSRDCLELNAIQNEREHDDIVNLHNEIRAKANTEAESNEERIRDMFKAQTAIRDRFVCVNDFLKECEEKEQAADKQIGETKLLHADYEQKIGKLTDDLNVLGDFHTQFKASVDQCKVFQQQIEKTVDESDLFETVDDFLARCDALMTAQVEIAEMEQSKIKQVELIREQMAKATNDATMIVIGLKNELAEIERCYLAAKTASLNWEKIFMASKNFIANSELTKNCVLDAIHQMYNMLCKRNGDEPTISRGNCEGQLDYIKDEIEILQEVVHTCRTDTAKANKSAASKSSSSKVIRKRTASGVAQRNIK